MRSFKRFALALFALATACSSPSSPSTPPTQNRQANTAAVSFRIVVPKATQARKAAYVSPSTAFVTVTDNAVPAYAISFNCSNGTCSGQLNVPVGANTFTFLLHDLYGKLLSSGSTTATILAGQVNTVSVTFNPVVVSIAMPTLNAPYGQAQQISVAPKALDADGNVIVGPGTYEDSNGNPVTVTAKVTDPLGGATLTKATSTGPNDPMTLSYNGVRHDKVIIDSTNSAGIPATNGSFVAIGSASTYTYKGNGPPVMTVGPDQALWLATDASGGFDVIRVASDGTQTTYGVPGPSGPMGLPMSIEPSGITTGPDGNLWVSGRLNGLVARVTPAGVATLFTGNGLDETYNLSVGPDGNLWTGNGISHNIARITTSGAITTYTIAPATSSSAPTTPASTAFGSNGLLYFLNWGEIDQFNISTNAVTYSTIGNNIEATDLIEGSDGNIWFTAFVSGVASYVGSMTPSGTISTTKLPQGVNFSQLVNGADGSPWYLDPYYGLRWVDKSGELGGFPVSFATGGGVAAVCVGADGSFWVSTYDPHGNTYLTHASY